MKGLKPKAGAVRHIDSHYSHPIYEHNLKPVDIMPSNFSSPEELFFGTADMTTIGTIIKEMLLVKGSFTAEAQNLPYIPTREVNSSVKTEAGKFYLALIHKSIASRDDEAYVSRSPASRSEAAERDTDAIISGLLSARELIIQKIQYQKIIDELKQQVATSEVNAGTKTAVSPGPGPGMF